MNNDNGQHVFFVDDEPTVREVIAATLEQNHLTVSCFESALDCLEHLQSRTCDLLIADLRMPAMDGIELTRQIKHRSPWIPVLILTGYGDIPTAVKAIKVGAVDLLEKPLDKKDFLDKVQSILGKNGNCAGKPLTASEKRVLKLVIDGKSNAEIASLFKRSKRTIEVHRARLMSKLGAKNLVDLVKRAAAMGLLELPAGEKPQGQPLEK